MRIGILGAGVVGQTLGAKLAELGHDVALGTRRPSELDEARGMAGSLRDWLEGTSERGRVTGFDEAASHGEVLVHATAGIVALDALEAAGVDNVAGKILIDVTNPLDFSDGFPPTLAVCNDESLAERIQAAVPDARVVKTLNTVTAALMVDPSAVGDGDHTLFVSGNDVAAKGQVAAWLGAWFGWRDVIDLGDITTARGTEMYLPLWVRLYGAMGTPLLNVKVVR